MVQSEVIKKKYLYEIAGSKIVDKIRTGEFKPGDQLPSEGDLSQLFGVSRNSIREAIKSLALIGLVDSQSGRGTFVTDRALLGLNNIALLEVLNGETSNNEIMEARFIIEPQLAALAAIRATPEEKAQLEQRLLELNADLSQLMVSDVKDNPTTSGMSFHMYIAAIAKNKLMSNFLISIKAELEHQRNKYSFPDNMSIDEMWSDHKRICDSIVAGDCHEAKRAMEAHILKVDTTLQKRMAACL